VRLSIGALLAMAVLTGCAASKNAAIGNGFQPGIVIIGTTGPLRRLSEAERHTSYPPYRRVAARWHPGQPPSLDAHAFRAKLAGWVPLRIGGIPGIKTQDVPVLVPEDRLHDTRFASAAGSLVLGTTGDLVVAKSDRDGMVWLERVLCSDDSTYRTCAHAYRHGLFDANTGQELDKHLHPKPKGIQIDVDTYVALPGVGSHELP
jgi:hypothetical protein